MEILRYLSYGYFLITMTSDSKQPQRTTRRLTKHILNQIRRLRLDTDQVTLFRAGLATTGWHKSPPDESDFAVTLMRL